MIRLLNMVEQRRILIATLALMLCIGALAGAPMPGRATLRLPSRLTDQEFWRISTEFSEPNGFFRSDNLLSNERWMQYVIPDLIRTTLPGGAYLGVGPEQNFTYIAAIRPRIAFITDIRRGNLHTQLMYKAIFELSADRAEFISRLFDRKRPRGLGANATAQDLFNAYTAEPAGNEASCQENLKAIRALLVDRHKFPLSAGDLEGIANVYQSFCVYGPEINYSSSGRSFGMRGGRFLSYADLMAETDEAGVNHGFLADEKNYRTVRELEEKNLIIPVVGDFAGPKALRAIGTYLKEHSAVVVAFYLSNVEQYLGVGWNTFCANVARMPLDSKSTFIRSSRGGAPSPGYWRGGGLMTSLGGMLEETKSCGGIPAAAGVSAGTRKR